MLLSLELEDGQTSHSEWTQLCTKYIPAKLFDCSIDDLNIFTHICGHWIWTCTMKYEPAELVENILDIMVQVALSILAQANSTQRVQNGQAWVLELWEEDNLLSERFGLTFRHLLHTLAQCYCKQCLAGDQDATEQEVIDGLRQVCTPTLPGLLSPVNQDIRHHPHTM